MSSSTTSSSSSDDDSSEMHPSLSKPDEVELDLLSLRPYGARNVQKLIQTFKVAQGNLGQNLLEVEITAIFCMVYRKLIKGASKGVTSITFAIPDDNEKFAEGFLEVCSLMGLSCTRIPINGSVDAELGMYHELIRNPENYKSKDYLKTLRKICYRLEISPSIQDQVTDLECQEAKARVDQDHIKQLEDRIKALESMIAQIVPSSTPDATPVSDSTSTPDQN